MSSENRGSPLVPRDTRSPAEQEEITARRIRYANAPVRRIPREVSTTGQLLVLGGLLLGSFYGLVRSRRDYHGTDALIGTSVGAGLRANAVIMLTDPRRVEVQDSTGGKTMLQKWENLYFRDGFDPTRKDEYEAVKIIDDVFTQLMTPDGRAALNDQAQAYYKDLLNNDKLSDNERNSVFQDMVRTKEWIDEFGRKVDNNDLPRDAKISGALLGMKQLGYKEKAVDDLGAAWKIYLESSAPPGTDEAGK